MSVVIDGFFSEYWININGVDHFVVIIQDFDTTPIHHKIDCASASVPFCH
jgi:hypothetical protein